MAREVERGEQEMKVKRYRFRISVLEPFTHGYDADWNLKACGVLRFHLRKRVDELLNQGYDLGVSILIEREEQMVWEREDDRRYYNRPKKQATLFGE